MPSTYSPDLRIELIATGEQSGTWGTTTNTNLGTLIEDAIAGYVSVSITSADQALTAQNGAADQARNMVVNLTTTTAANFNVYVPPVNKFYVIRNSSAYQATIYCSTVIGNTTAAGTGIAIPAGKETIIFSDGTNIVSAIDYAPSLVLGAALPVASGGTGLTAGTSGGVLYYSAAGTLASSAALAANALVKGGGAGVAPSTITTGTNVLTALGVNVGTAGAFVVNGGALGTPASGTLTNCTFPTLNQNTTGTAAGLSATLVATSGGTGQSSYAVGDLLFASTTTALSKLADVATGNALISGGVGVAPSYGKIGLTTHVSGTLPVANGGTGRGTATAYAVICGGTTSTGAQQSIASVGTAGQVLTSNGAGALPTFQAAGGGFTAGTLMLFQQTAAPTGWTKQTTHDNKALRVVSGTASSGGSVTFSTAFASQGVNGSVGNTTLSTSQIPSHSHSFTLTGGDGGANPPGALYNGSTGNAPSVTTSSTGGGGAHNHSFSGTAINLAVQYVDLIIASKD